MILCSDIPAWQRRSQHLTEGGGGEGKPAGGVDPEQVL